MMVSVDEALRIVLEHAGRYGSEAVELETAAGRVLARSVRADRDMPPYDRATMDGIAVKFGDLEAGRRDFRIAGVQAAGDEPAARLNAGSCVQIMTGAAVPAAADTVIPVEDIVVAGGRATLLAGKDAIRGQFIHVKGSDGAAGITLMSIGQIISPAAVAIAASVGQQRLRVTKPPKIVVVTTGNELVGVDEQPAPYQIRRSNGITAQAALAPYGVEADALHLPDDPDVMKRELGRCLGKYDAIIVSGGVSKGKFDYVPGVFEDLSVKMLFHGVRQKPGKPFWFGARRGGPVVFALPGNPVSTFLCLYRYVLPWLRASIGLPEPAPLYAVLDAEVEAPGSLHYFLQAGVHADPAGRLHATPIDSTGSGDYRSLLNADAFLEIPPHGSGRHNAGEAYKILAIRPIL